MTPREKAEQMHVEKANRQAAERAKEGLTAAEKAHERSLAREKADMPYIVFAAVLVALLIAGAAVYYGFSGS